MKASKKALILSGGGGRGAYHVGVLEALVECGWLGPNRAPDIIAGTSIGAINAAALASGMSVADLKGRWRAMRTENVHRLSPDLPAISRPVLRFFMQSVLTSKGREQPMRLPRTEGSFGSPSVLERLRAVFAMRPFRSLLDTTPWRRTLAGWVDFARVNSAEAPALLLAATDVRTGALETFCNRDRDTRPRDHITLDHLMASSSIPIVYPWTAIGDHQYWDGAVLANTPLGPVIDLAGDEDVEIVVVMMTPWHEDAAALRTELEQLPRDVVQALALTLDWSLLASYRAALKMLRAANHLADAAEKLERAAIATGDASLRVAGPVPRRISEPLVVAPEQLMPLEWIVDYERANHEALFEMGRADARRALASRQLAREAAA